MASSFSFGFAGDDIDDVESDHGAADALQSNDLAAIHPPAEAPAFNEAKKHDIDELVCLLSNYLFCILFSLQFLKPMESCYGCLLVLDDITPISN